jgi:hypothetical protein
MQKWDYLRFWIQLAMTAKTSKTGWLLTEWHPYPFYILLKKILTCTCWWGSVWNFYTFTEHALIKSSPFSPSLHIPFSISYRHYCTFRGTLFSFHIWENMWYLPFLFGSFYWTWCPPGPSILLQMTRFPSYLWLNKTLLCINATFFSVV